MSRNTLLARLTPLIRKLTDLSLKLSGTLIAYDNVTLYRYSVEETSYRDRTKTLLETVNNVHMYIDFPGETPLLNTKLESAAIHSVTFIEDLLPIIAIFPWKHNGQHLKVDIADEFDIKLYDEFDNEHSLRFEITERKSDFVEQHVYREYIVVPKREETIAEGEGQTGTQQTGSPSDDTYVPEDPNLALGSETVPIFSEYD
jgi:hypothetical protein